LTAACPLCNGNSVIISERISVKNVVSKYKHVLNIDVSSEFGESSYFYYKRCGCCDLGYFTPVFAASMRLYEMLQVFPWYYMNDKNEYEFANRFVKSTDNILEIGCGKGAFSKHISPRSYKGLELNLNAQRIACQNSISVLNESIQEHCNLNLSYDVVCAFQVLEHVAETRSFIESAVKCLKSDGLLILSTPSIDSFASIVPNYILDMPPHHVTRWSDAAYKKLAEIFNLELIELWHEPLQKVHRNFYVQTVLTNFIMRLLNQRNLVWNDSYTFKFANLVCSLPSRLFSFMLPFPFVTPRGISVTAVFRKKVGV